MVKIKNFLYGTAVLVASVAALYGFTLVERSAGRQAPAVTYTGGGRLGGQGTRGASQYAYTEGFS